MVGDNLIVFHSLNLWLKNLKKGGLPLRYKGIFMLAKEQKKISTNFCGGRDVAAGGVICPGQIAVLLALLEGCW